MAEFMLENEAMYPEARLARECIEIHETTLYHAMRVHRFEQHEPRSPVWSMSLAVILAMALGWTMATISPAVLLLGAALFVISEMGVDRG